MAVLYRNPTYRPEIDGLRALAVLVILLNHAGVAWLPGGYLGVDIFFVISGYVITRILVGELQGGTFSLAAFWRRRVRRILPALAALLVVCLPMAWFSLSPAQMERFLPVFLGATALVPNVVLYSDTGYFNTEAATQPLLHLWSLGVEEQFYLLFPLILLIVWRRKPSALGPALSGLALVAMAMTLHQAETDPRAAFYLLPARAVELLVGSLTALLLWSPPRALRQFGSLAAMVVIAVTLVTYHEIGPGLALMLPVLCTALCILLAGPDTWVGRALALRPVVWLGKVSFGTYLWHWPLLAFARVIAAEEPQLAVKLALMLVAIGLGWASWRLIEEPFRRSTSPILPKWGVGAGLGTLVTLALAGGLAVLSEARGWRNLNWPGYAPGDLARLQDMDIPLQKSGTCHLTDHKQSAEPFLQAWNCPAAAEPGLAGWPVAVFGDSHAANFTKVIRLTGRNPMQMTGWNCSPVPSLMRSDCRRMAEELRDAAREQGIQTVILSNLWDAAERRPERLVEMRDWWGEVFETVVIIAPLPQFTALEERLLRWERDRIAALPPDLDRSAAFLRAFAQLDDPRMLLIDPVPLFCADRPGCTVLGQGPLMHDESGHLTVEGATIYARALLASDLLGGLAP